MRPNPKFRFKREADVLSHVSIIYLPARRIAGRAREDSLCVAQILQKLFVSGKVERRRKAGQPFEYRLRRRR